MRIVHVTQFLHPQKGYQENHLARLSAKRGWEVKIIASTDLTTWGIPLSDIDRVAQMDREFCGSSDIEIFRLKSFFQFSRRLFIRGLAKKIDEQKPDILFLHGVMLWTTLGALFFSKSAKDPNVKIIIDDHMVNAGVKNSYLHFFSSFTAKLLKMATRKKQIRWVGVSSETVDFMRENYRLKEPIELIQLGYNDEVIRRDEEGGQDWLRSQGFTANQSFILYIGKIDDRKNPLDLVKAFKELRKDKPDLKLLLVGEIVGNYGEKLKSYITSNQLKNEVIVLPPVKNQDIGKVFSVAQAVIWPHGSSMAMLEAMACKCPAVASIMDVNQERLGENRGVLFEEGNISSMNKAINKALSDRDEIVTNALQWIKQFSWKTIEKKFFDQYSHDS